VDSLEIRISNLKINQLLASFYSHSFVSMLANLITMNWQLGIVIYFLFISFSHNTTDKKQSVRRAEFVPKAHLTAELICVISKDDRFPKNRLRRSTLVYDWEEEPLALEGKQKK
jgi:hypothetical protein